MRIQKRRKRTILLITTNMGDLNVRFCNNNEGTQKHMENTEIKQKTSMEEGGRPMCKKRLNKDNDIHKYT